MADRTSFADTVRELWDLLKDYARQETLDPLRGLGRYLAYGVGAAALTALGLGLLLLGLLRAVQTEAGELWRGLDGAGDSSVVPYAVVFVVATSLLVLTATRIGKQFGDDR